MKRRWNGWVWGGFLLVVAGFLSYLPIFVNFPITRDFPWANLLLFCAGLWLVTIGVRKAYRQSEVYGGKVLGPLFLGIGVLAIGLFVFGVCYEVRQLPPASGAPQVGQKAPDFTLPDQNGNPVSLSGLLKPTGTGSNSARQKGV